MCRQEQGGDEEGGENEGRGLLELGPLRNSSHVLTQQQPGSSHREPSTSLQQSAALNGVSCGHEKSLHMMVVCTPVRHHCSSFHSHSCHQGGTCWTALHLGQGPQHATNAVGRMLLFLQSSATCTAFNGCHHKAAVKCTAAPESSLCEEKKFYAALQAAMPGGNHHQADSHTSGARRDESLPPAASSAGRESNKAPNSSSQAVQTQSSICYKQHARMSTPKGGNADFWGDDEVGADLNT